MVPPTDPWYEDLTGDYPPRPGQGQGAVAETNAATPRCACASRTCPYAVACGQVVKSQLEQVGINVEPRPARVPGSVAADGVQGRTTTTCRSSRTSSRGTCRRCSANPQYYTQYNNPQLQADIAAADAGTTDEQVT